MACTVPNEYKDYLNSIPSKWRQQILDFLEKIKNDAVECNCERLKECETLTELSEFTIDGTEVCITYTDEKGVQVERCFDVSDMLNNSLYDVDPKCITTVTTWRNMSFVEKMQAIVDKVCELPNPPVSE